MRTDGAEPDLHGLFTDALSALPAVHFEDGRGGGDPKSKTRFCNAARMGSSWKLIIGLSGESGFGKVSMIENP